MEPFARIVIGYHGCTEAHARDLLLGAKPLREWQASTNDWDWLGHGIYFWEHSAERALRWAKEKYVSAGETPAVLGAVLQLGRCFDLLNEATTGLVADSYVELAESFKQGGLTLPKNQGKDWKRRELDCLVINDCLARVRSRGVEYDTVRGAFLEGAPTYPGAGFSREAHIQIAVRNPACILGVFQPHWQYE
jgi:hypothetical protein